MTPRVAAHRGWSARFPENTLPAFAAARIPGVAAIEFDVQLSRDGVPVVVHDETLARIGPETRRIADLDVETLQRLDAGSWKDAGFAGTRIPRLEEAVDELPDRELWIEVKVYPGDIPSGRARGTVAGIERVVASRGAEDRSRILCFHRPTLETSRLRRVWNLEYPVEPAEFGEGLFAVDIDVDALTPAFAEQVRQAGLALMCYTVNTDVQLRRALRCGVDAMICDDPAWTLAALA